MLPATTGQSPAATYVWDGGSNGWDTSTAWWNTGGAWVNGNDSFAIFNFFASPPHAITLGEPITTGGLTFNASGYTVAGSGANTLTLAAPTPGSGLFSPFLNVAAFQNATIQALLAGTAGFTKTGNGTLNLTNNANSYTGETVINAGSLVITNEGQLGTSTGTISINGISQTGQPGFSGGQLVVQGALGGVTMTRDISILGRGPGAVNGSGGLVSVGYNTFNGDLLVAGPASESRVAATHGITTINGQVLLGSQPEIFLGNGNFIVEGQVTGFDANADRLIKAGTILPTTLWLKNNNNSFLQTVRMDSGWVRVTDNGALGRNTTARAIDFSWGGLEVHTDNPNFQTRNIYNRAANGYLFLNRALGGSGINQTVQFGRFDADNATFYSRGRDGYSLSFDGEAGPGSTTTWNGGGNMAFYNESNGLLTFNGSMRHDEAAARTFTVGGHGDTLMTGSFLGAGGGAHVFTKSGNGTFTLQGGISDYTGATNVTAGTLSIGTFGAINAAAGVLNIGSSGTTAALQYTGPGETATKVINLAGTTGGAILLADGTGPLEITSAFTATGAGIKTLTLGGGSTAANTISGAIVENSGTNKTSLLKFGSGSWTLSGANTFTGTTTVTDGALKIQDTFGATSRDVLPNAGNVIFNRNDFTNAAGGLFQYLGDGANASSESVGQLVPSAGAGTVMVTAGAGGTATLTFSSLGTVSAGSGVNFVTNAGGSVAITGVANTNGIVNGHLFFNGADFAADLGSDILGAASYTLSDAGAILTGGNTLPYHVTTADIAGQTSATINAGIKFSDSRSLALGSGQTLTLQNGAATVSGGILVTGGSSVSISGGTGLTTGGAADLVFRTDSAADTLTLSTPVTSTTTGGWTKLGLGTLELGAANANTGFVNINEGTVRLTTGARLGADSIDVNLRQGAVLDLNGVSLGTAASATGSLDELNGAGLITNSGANASIRMGNNNSNSYFTGSIQDGAGTIQLVKNGSNSFRIAGPQTYSGGVVINAGNFIVNHLANIGQASGLGTGDATSDATNAASLVFNGGVLYYRGSDGTYYQTTQTPSVSIDRLFTLQGNATIYSEGRYGGPNRESASNHAALIFNNPAPIAFSGTGVRTLTLRGDSTGDNEIALQLTDNAGSALTLNKNDAGHWILSNPANSYTGQTQIDNGSLRAIDGASLPTASNLRLGGNGVLQTHGMFDRAIGTGADQVQWNTNSSGGFAASHDRLAVNLGGAGATLMWGANGIGNGTGGLVLNSTTSWADVDFQNGIDLNGANRAVSVNDNLYTGLDYAALSGVISNSSGTPAGLIKGWGGTLILGNANTYNGDTQLQDGHTIVTSIGNATGTTASSLGASGGTLFFNGNATTGLLYVGSGETATRPIRISTALSDTRTYRIDNSGSGPLVLTDVANITSNARGVFFELRGINTDANTISSVLSDGGHAQSALAVPKYEAGVWILGNTANTFSGGVRADGGTLGFMSDGSLGATGTLAPTTAASSNSSTVTVASTAGLKVGMYVNGNGVGYGDYITSIPSATTFTLNSARTIAAGTPLQFGGLMISNAAIFAADPAAGLTISQPV